MTSDTPAPPRETRTEKDEVVAWMAAGNGSYKLAAAHFGLSPYTVRDWAREVRRAAESPPPVADVPRAPPGVLVAPEEPAKVRQPPPPPTGPRRKPGEGVVRVEDMSETLRFGLRRGLAGIVSALSEIADVQEARQAARDRRAQLRAEGVPEDVIDERAPLPPPPDLKSADAGGRTLKSILEVAPGLAGFEVEMGGKAADGAPTEEEREALYSALCPPQGGGLRLVAKESGR